MRIYTVFDDKFIEMAKSFINSHQYYSRTTLHASIPENSLQSIKLCKNKGIEHIVFKYDYSSKQTSRILKMGCACVHTTEEPIAYLDIDIIFQNDIGLLEELNPNFVWTLSKREGHQTSIRKWKRHYLTNRHVEFAREKIPLLAPDLPIEEILEYPVRNCGVIYGNRSPFFDW